MGQEHAATGGRLAALREWWMRQGLAVRLAVIVAAGIAVAGISMGVLMVTGGEAAQEEEPPPTVATPEPTPTPTPTELATPSPSPSPTATPPPQRDPVASMSDDLRNFINNFGFPEATDYAVLRVPVVGLETGVSARSVGRGAAMPDPIGPAHVVWYDLSEFRGMGGAPGEGGNAIFSGHVDYNWHIPYAGITYDGRGIFYDLHLVEEGDLIEIEHEGETLEYYVTWVESLSANPAVTDWGEIWAGNEGVDEITLYTCGGDFDPVTATYEDRVVIRAERL